MKNLACVKKLNCEVRELEECVPGCVRRLGEVIV